MITAIKSSPTPGYVYVFANPALPGWHKVGHTYRPPHRRARELSRTALPAVFETAYARFFWDAPRAERTAHARLNEVLPSVDRSKEFFRTDADSLRALIEGIPSPSLDGLSHSSEPFAPDAPWWVSAPDANWSRTLDGLEEQWSWAVERIHLNDQAENRRGWRELERLSSSGWGEGSWRLADLIVRTARRPGTEIAERAAWVAEAAELQGIEGGFLRAAWLRSGTSEPAFARWLQALENAWTRWGARGCFPPHVLDTLHEERHLWVGAPRRRSESPWWPALDALPSQA